MRKFVALVTALCLLVAAAPATSVALDHADLHAAKAKKKKKKKKKKIRYRISINAEWTSKDISDCRSGTNGDAYRIKNTTTTTTKFSETGFYPGGSRRTGFRETSIKTESNDPYVPSDEQKTRQDIQQAFSGDHWDFQINAKRTKFSYDWEDAAGDIDDVVIRAPTKVGRTTSKDLTDDWSSPKTTDEDGRCTSWSERSVTETVSITRVQ